MKRGRVSRAILRRGMFTALVVLLLTVVSMASCAAKENSSTTPTSLIPISVQGRLFVIDTNKAGSFYELESLTTEFPANFTMGDYTGWEIKINDVLVEANTNTKIQIDKIEKDSYITVEMKNLSTNQVQKQYFYTLPPRIFAYTTLSNVEDGFYYYGDQGCAFKMNHLGEIVFYFQDFSEEEKYINDFQRVELNGNVFYLISAYHKSEKYPPLTLGGGPNTKVYVLNAEYYILDVIDALGETEKTPAGIPLDAHDVKMLGVDHYLVIGYVGQYVKNVPDNVPHNPFGDRVVAAVIQEIKDGEVVFEWYSTDYPELYSYFVDDFKSYASAESFVDYMHINSVDIDPEDGNIIASFRSLCAMMKIDRTTGEIIWILGGKGDDFNLTDEQKTSYQHDFRKIGTNVYSVFDNGNVNGQTRVLEYTLDEENKKLVSFKEYMIPGYFSAFQGNAQKIEGYNSRYVMPRGVDTNNFMPMIMDVDFETEEILFQIISEDRPAGQDAFVYRVYRYNE